MSETTTADVLAKVSPDPPEQFSPTRYPYTYAYDFLRNHTHVAPREAFEKANETRHVDDRPIFPERLLARGEASRVVEEWATLEGRDKDSLCVVLADAYLSVNGVDR